MVHRASPRTPAERLLAGAFTMRGWEDGRDWAFEPPFPGRRRRPDFRLLLGGWRLLLEVKEFGPSGLAPGVPRRGCLDRVASKVRAAQRQLREFRDDHLCAAVLRSGEDGESDLSDPFVTMGAFVGDRSFPEHRGAPGRTRVRFRADDPPLAALIVVRDVPGAGGVPSAGLTIFEHPLALPGFPSHLFRGPWDVHWALREDGFRRVFVGAAAADEETATVAGVRAA